MIRMAVLKIMEMNNSLYNHLYSDRFDVPDYEKENILYNNEVSTNDDLLLYSHLHSDRFDVPYYD